MTLISEEDAQAWLQYRKITAPGKPSSFGDGTWRCRLIRPSKEGFAIDSIRDKSVASLLEAIAAGAWDGFPTRKTGLLADKLWSFFTQTELREIYTLTQEED